MKRTNLSDAEGARSRRFHKAFKSLLMLPMILCGSHVVTLAQQAAESPDVGKRVITQYGTVLQVGGQVVDDEGRGKQLARGKDHKDFRIYKVEQANGPWLWLVAEGSGVKGWAQAANVILFEQAVDHITNQIRANPGAAANYLWRANVWRARKELDIAIADYNEAIRIDPGDALAYNNRGLAWGAKKDYDKAISDYNEAIRLDQGNAWATYRRAVVELIKERSGAVEDARRAYELSGPQDGLAPYGVLVGYLGARRQGRDQDARAFLDQGTKLDSTAWPAPIVRFFLSAISEQELMAAATDNDKQTEAHCFVGYQHLLAGDKSTAREQFTWVRDHGNPAFTEYTMSLAELEKLDRAAKQ